MLPALASFELGSLWDRKRPGGGPACFHEVDAHIPEVPVSRASWDTVVLTGPWGLLQ